VKYAFIRKHVERFRIASLCRALGVSRSGYYEWLDRPESPRVAQDRQLLQSIRALHLQSRQAYGAYKTWRVLRARGIACGRHRVARLSRQNGIEALRKRRFRVMTEHHKLPPPAPNRLAQNFRVGQPDQVLGRRHDGDCDRRRMAAFGCDPRSVLAPGGGLGHGQ